MEGSPRWKTIREVVVVNNAGNVDGSVDVFDGIVDDDVAALG